MEVVWWWCGSVLSLILADRQHRAVAEHARLEIGRKLFTLRVDAADEPRPRVPTEESALSAMRAWLSSGWVWGLSARKPATRLRPGCRGGCSHMSSTMYSPPLRSRGQKTSRVAIWQLCLWQPSSMITSQAGTWRATHPRSRVVCKPFARCATTMFVLMTSRVLVSRSASSWYARLS